MAEHNTISNISFDQLIKDVSRKTGYTKVVIGDAVRVTFDTIRGYLYNRHKVRIPKFGMFYSKPKRGQVHVMPNEDRSNIYHRPYNRPKFRYSTQFMNQMKRIKSKGDNDEE